MSSYNAEKYKNKSILVIGGGTSTLDVNWEEVDYDFICTCNDFFLEERVVTKPIDLYLLAYTTPFDSKLVSKLKGSSTSVFFEPTFYRGKQNSLEFKKFKESIGIDIFSMDIPYLTSLHSEGHKAGAAFRLVQLAVMSEASKVYFVGFDGFNKEFGNKHAFTKHIGLKDTDTRRDWQTDYHGVFVEAFRYLNKMKGSEKLQNLGEGQDYNLGTEISKLHFPLDEKTLEVLGKSSR